MNCAGIKEVLESAVAAGEVVGAVGLVTDAEGTRCCETAGMRDLEKGTAMTEDTVFCIASMTKPITAIAVLMMVDEGRLALDDSLAKYLPEFRKLKDERGRMVEVTLRECLSHTSGMSDLELEEEDECRVLGDLVPRILAKPVKFEPGTKWEYCQTSINMAAHVVEVLSGMGFADFLEERIFAKLGMGETGFYPDAGRIERLCPVYARDGDGWTKTSHDWVTHGRLAGEDRFPKANAGLFSTAGDYARFCRCLLNEGRGVISGESYREFSTVQTGELETGFTPGNGWGLGCAITREPQGVTGPLSVGTFGHGGLYGTQGWIDPVRKRADILMLQRSDFENADGSEIRRMFHEAAAL